MKLNKRTLKFIALWFLPAAMLIPPAIVFFGWIWFGMNVSDNLGTRMIMSFFMGIFVTMFAFFAWLEIFN